MVTNAYRVEVEAGADGHASAPPSKAAAAAPPAGNRKLALETRVLDGRAIGGWRVRPQAGFPDMYPSTKQRKYGEMAGKAFQRGGTGASFFCVVVLVHFPPPALEVTRDLD
jgi:hypothetical protein